VRPDDPHLDAGPWLHELGAACRAAGVMLILDEITTGFRLAYGGAQEVFGLRPDLVVYGKAVGGGLPLGVVAGRADVMRVFGPDAGAEGIFAASSFAGNPLSIAAGLATLSHLSAARTRVYPGLEAQAERLRAGFAAIAADLGVAAALRRAGSILRVGLGPDPPRGRGGAALRRAEDSFATHVLNAGVLMQAGLRGFLSTAHEAAHVERVLAAFASALAEVKADGLLGAVGRV
jgi:glutamate-1-semialdehyde 2,1-aminomutase